ncbi:MAG: S-methyl-5-thioribose-1-phosphate isomerase [Ignavibacteriae bacterium]|nr:S-methyl-5-thioribose-1-phosphate isomerase [Ignavibacteriota bacterium]
MISLEWRDGVFRFLDQTKLPHQEVYVETDDYRIVGEAIRKLEIRGAPAIGVAAAFGLVLAAHAKHIESVRALNEEFYAAMNFLSQTRPTAVNLFLALERMRRTLDQNARADLSNLRRILLAEAKAIQQEDIDACMRIGEFGSSLITLPSSILTHCNTGALATAGTGTAQSVITTAAKQGNVVRVFADETRPLFQGARLTAWELMKAGIDVTLITDGTAGLLMQKREVDLVIVGADRIAANGDTANKIGTYVLAVLARQHGVPFYVAAPTTTIDVNTRSGKNIPIEERSPRDVTHIGDMRIAAPGVSVFAPAFDVTPNDFITAIVTEVGVLRPPFLEAIAALKKGEPNSPPKDQIPSRQRVL